MSDDDLENDDLEVGDDDETEEGLEAAAEDVAEDDGGDSAALRPPKARPRLRCRSTSCRASKPRTRSVMPWPRPWKSSWLARRQGAGSGGQCGRRSAQEAGQQVRQPPYLSACACLLKKPAVAAGFFVLRFECSCRMHDSCRSRLAGDSDKPDANVLMTDRIASKPLLQAFRAGVVSVQRASNSGSSSGCESLHPALSQLPRPCLPG